jgi:hypothetical protein
VLRVDPKTGYRYIVAEDEAKGMDEETYIQNRRRLMMEHNTWPTLCGPKKDLTRHSLRHVLADFQLTKECTDSEMGFISISTLFDLRQSPTSFSLSFVRRFTCQFLSS